MAAAVLSLLRPARPAAAAIEPAGCHRLRRAATGCDNRPLLYTPGVAPRRLARPRRLPPVPRRWAALEALEGGTQPGLDPARPASVSRTPRGRPSRRAGPRCVWLVLRGLRQDRRGEGAQQRVDLRFGRGRPARVAQPRQLLVEPQ